MADWWFQRCTPSSWGFMGNKPWSARGLTGSRLIWMVWWYDAPFCRKSTFYPTILVRLHFLGVFEGRFYLWYLGYTSFSGIPTFKPSALGALVRWLRLNARRGHEEAHGCNPSTRRQRMAANCRCGYLLGVASFIIFYFWIFMAGWWFETWLLFSIIYI